MSTIKASPPKCESVKLVVKSSVLALSVGELSFWALLVGYLMFVRPMINETDDMTPLIVSLFLGFFVRPALAGITALILLILFFKKSKWSVQGNVTGVIQLSLVFGLTLAIVVTSSVVLSAVEAGGNAADILGIYRLFLP